MFELLKTKTEKINPRRAAEFLKMNTFENQRNLDSNWVQTLIARMHAGKFTKASIAFAKNGDGVDFLMNGQHQCDACVQSNRPFIATIDYYKCHDEVDMRHLFATFDAHRQRTEGHVMKAARGLFKSEALHNVPLRTLSACGSSLVWLGSGTTPSFNAKVISKSDKADLVEKYESDVLAIASYGICNIQTPVVCAMIATHRTNDSKAREFWERVLLGDQLVRNTPQWNLHRGLSECHRHVGGSSRAPHIYRLSILWWNAFVTGQSRSIAKVRNMKTIPEVMGAVGKPKENRESETK